MTQPQLLSVNTGLAATLLLPQSDQWPRGVQTGIRKTPVSDLQTPTPVLVRPLGLEGDEQVDLTVHGGLDKALYAFCQQHYEPWKRWLTEVGGAADRLETPGAFGENLTVSGLEERQVFVGDQWVIGEVVLEVTAPRSPCYKFNALMKTAKAAKQMFLTEECGWYLRVVQPGSILAGLAIEVRAGARQTNMAQALRLKRPKN
mgnify:CR=1 FL=1|jgi:MOSC domain-containing protein YiiM